ncbi:hypothetical protein ET1_01_00010 [Edwardsiella tarda ATCC 15947 = NBRC 105688]|nr:hypothetical protein ET1_01_00010 [Edwardsiella tarda ATCC 15947 = NBRC 105688]
MTISGGKASIIVREVREVMAVTIKKAPSGAFPIVSSLNHRNKPAIEADRMLTSVEP